MIGLHTVTVTPIGGAALDVSCLVDTVGITHGRADTDSQPDASAATIDISTDTADAPIPTAIDIGATITITTTLDDPHVRFTGTITDISQGWDAAGEDTPDKAVMQVIATSTMANLGRKVVGDVPWPQELDGARVAHILAAAGVTLDPAFSDPGTVQILPRDVDSKDALGLAQEVASDAGGLLWETTGAEVRYADADHRRNAQPALALDACQILVTPTWRRTTEGIVNSVSIGYGLAPVDPPEGESTEAPRYVADRPDSIDRWGEFAISTTTQLANLADAQAMGQLLLTQNNSPVWLLGALPVDMVNLTKTDTATILGLDVHSLLSVTGLPAAGAVPTSTALWVEGWTETLAWDVHDINLVVSGYCRTSPPPRWDDMNPAMTWDTAPGTWDGAACFGPVVNLGRWNDQPATLRWDQVDPAQTWDTYH